jgi:hypothetical protein
MKESITKFDLESAFKALDEIEIPKAGKVKANRPALTEIFSRKSRFDALMEEYYDISNNAGLEDAKEAREAEIAQAKLARIEKIVDLEADSAEDLLTSYVGKLIIQCPQCMTLFYKSQEDIEASEDDPATVNVNEVCQHCGNESGYSLIGKVGEADSNTEEAPAAEEPVAEDELDLEVTDEATEEGTDEASEEDELADLEAELADLDSIDLEEPAEEKKEESFNAGTGEALVEELADDKELDDKLEAHSEYIEYLRTAIAQEEEKLEKATNEQVKVAIQRNIDAFKTDLDAALPDSIKNELSTNIDTEAEIDSSDEQTESKQESEAITEAINVINNNSDSWSVKTYGLVYEEVAREIDGKFDFMGDLTVDYKKLRLIMNIKRPIYRDELEEVLNAINNTQICKKNDFYAEFDGMLDDSNVRLAISRANTLSLKHDLKEDATDLEVSNDEFEELMKSSEFQKPISDTAVRAMLAADKEEDTKEESLDTVFSDVDELEEDKLEYMISDSLTEMYGNVAGFRLKDCLCANNKLMVEGVIHFTSGKARKTTYTFNEAFIENDKVILRGLNEKLGSDKHFYITGVAENKTFITESFRITKNI